MINSLLFTLSVASIIGFRVQLAINYLLLQENIRYQVLVGKWQKEFFFNLIEQTKTQEL